MENFNQCPTCGGHQLIKKSGTYTCSFCGNVYYDSRINSEFYSLLDLALAQRQTAKFDESFETYNMIINKFQDQDLSDVYFGMFLCEFSVIFESNLSGVPFPSFYHMRKTSCYGNYYYKKAVDLAENNNPEKLKIFNF